MPWCICAEQTTIRPGWIQQSVGNCDTVTQIYIHFNFQTLYAKRVHQRNGDNRILDHTVSHGSWTNLQPIYFSFRFRVYQCYVFRAFKCLYDHCYFSFPFRCSMYIWYVRTSYIHVQYLILCSRRLVFVFLEIFLH